jgi:uncharacterized protein YbjT (DUF2867 family)
VIVRRPLATKDPKINELVINFDDLSSVIERTIGDALICTLGTTKKKTPDKKCYREVDLTYTLISAKGALENGHKQVHLVSSIGANEKSSVFYPALKGEIERLISDLSFESTFIYRPSILIGKRETARPLEWLSQRIFYVINPLLIGALKKYRSISGEQVAKKIINELKKNKVGKYSFESNELETP